jgi:hypothetical protein
MAYLYDPNRAGLYRKALEKAQRDLAYAISKRDCWNLEIIKAQNAVRSMAAMAANADIANAHEAHQQVGMPQAVESIVNGAPEPITPAEVKQALDFYGFHTGRYANAISMVHQTLTRLTASGRIREVSGKYTRSVFYEALLKV